jgi:hypothetical protein
MGGRAQARRDVGGSRTTQREGPTLARGLLGQQAALSHPGNHSFRRAETGPGFHRPHRWRGRHPSQRHRPEHPLLLPPGHEARKKLASPIVTCSRRTIASFRT